MIPSSEISFWDFDSVHSNFRHVIAKSVGKETSDFHASIKENGIVSRVRLLRPSWRGECRKWLQERVIIVKLLETCPDIWKLCLTGDQDKPIKVLSFKILFQSFRTPWWVMSKFHCRLTGCQTGPDCVLAWQAPASIQMLLAEFNVSSYWD